MLCSAGVGGVPLSWLWASEFLCPWLSDWHVSDSPRAGKDWRELPAAHMQGILQYLPSGMQLFRTLLLYSQNKMAPPMKYHHSIILFHWSSFQSLWALAYLKPFLGCCTSAELFLLKEEPSDLMLNFLLALWSFYEFDLSWLFIFPYNCLFTTSWVMTCWVYRRFTQNTWHFNPWKIFCLIFFPSFFNTACILPVFSNYVLSEK